MVSLNIWFRRDFNVLTSWSCRKTSDLFNNASRTRPDQPSRPHFPNQMIQITNIPIRNSFESYKDYVLKVMAAYAFVQILWFYYCRRTYPLLFNNNSRALGWLLTWTIACVITPFGIPFAVQVLVNENQNWMNNNISYTLAACFLSYLICDIIFGSVYYPKRFGIVTGWFHHLLYIWIIYEFMANSKPRS
jgi:hypothetical protein